MEASNDPCEADPLRVFSHPDLELDTPLVDQYIEQDQALTYGSSPIQERTEQQREQAQIKVIKALKKMFGNDYKTEYPFGSPMITRIE